MRKITFRSIDDYANLTGHKPIPARKNLPGFYLKHPLKVDKTFLSIKGKSELTVKSCMPFLDAMSAGYLIKTEQDIEVQDKDGVKILVWQTGGNVIETHGQRQIPSELISDEYYPLPFKFNSKWAIKTPRGWSLLLCHPLNRTDLPFHTFAGIVDTDKYYPETNMPFLIKKDFVGIIPMGTPIAQVIPIKRDNWFSIFTKHNETQRFDQLRKVQAHIRNGYKNLFWVKKDYL